MNQPRETDGKYGTKPQSLPARGLGVFPTGTDIEFELDGQTRTGIVAANMGDNVRVISDGQELSVPLKDLSALSVEPQMGEHFSYELNGKYGAGQFVRADGDEAIMLTPPPSVREIRVPLDSLQDVDHAPSEAQSRAALHIKEWAADEEPATQVKDIITDLRHYCDARGIDFHDAIDSSYRVYLDEKGDPYM